MVKYKAWVITWLRNSVAENGNMPATPIGAPLALLPGNSATSRIEGAMVAMYQLIGGSYPSDGVGFLKRTPTDKVRWDYLRLNASIGHDPQVLAYHAEIDYRLSKRDPLTGEGRISYTHSKWTERGDYREASDIALAAGEDVYAAHESAVRTLRERVTTWQPSTA